MNSIYFVTSNKGKFIEAEKKFRELKINIIQKDFGYPEIQADTLLDVAKYGVTYLKKKLDKPFILEDAGIFIDSLEGFPGVYSKYVYYTIGCKGILKLIEEENNRNAVFRSVYAYNNKDETKFFTGICKGCISDKIIGTKGFGYDPIFIPNGSDKTFAQMDVSRKNSFSHRGKALDKLVDFFKKN